jgi:rSAM/selenodomain-associated transferase 2
MPRCEQLLIGNPGRAAQMNLGAAGLDTDYLLFLHADTRPQFDLAYFARRLQSQPLWGFCPVILSGSHWLLRWVERGISWRSRATGIGTGDQMLFVRRDVFEAQGGFAGLPLMEDVELCKRLRRLARPLVLDEPVLTSSRRWEARGIVRTVLQMWSLRFAYLVGVSPHRLWRAYYG